jgi:hypothetical protein
MLAAERPRSVTPPALAKELGVAVEKVLHWIRTKQIEAINVSTDPTMRARWVISREAIDAFFARRANTAIPSPEPVRRPRRQQQDITEYFR